MDQECSCFTVLTGGLLAPVDLEDHGCTGGSRPMANVVVLRSLSSRSDWFAQGCSCIHRLYPQTPGVLPLKKQSRKTLKEEQAFLYFPPRYRSPPEKEKQKLLSAPRPYTSARNSQFRRALSPWLWGGRAHPPFSSNSFTCWKVLVLPSLVFSSPPLSWGLFLQPVPNPSQHPVSAPRPSCLVSDARWAGEFISASLRFSCSCGLSPDCTYLLRLNGSERDLRGARPEKGERADRTVSVPYLLLTSQTICYWSYHRLSGARLGLHRRLTDPGCGQELADRRVE